MSRFPLASLDLSLLPAPQVVQPVDYEAIRSARIADLTARLTAAGIPYDVGALETDPGVILQEEDAYRESLDMAAINDAAKAVMWAFATGGDQDNLGALIGIRRLTIVPADPIAGTPAVMESDDAFRRRGQIALDATAIGLTGGGYEMIAKQAAPTVKSVGLVKSVGGMIAVILQGYTGDGTVTSDVVAAVNAALQADDGGQLTDIVSVRSVAPFAYDIVANAAIPLGPSASIVQAASTAALQAAASALQVIGGVVPTDALIAAGRVAPITKFTLVSPSADIVPAKDQNPYCRSVTVNVVQGS